MGRISRETIDKIMDTARIEEVIGEFVNLKKSGQNYKGFSPFTDERNPSFYVSPAKNIFKCFSSNKGGSVVTFLMEHEHYTYPEALRYLARKYGIDIEEDEQSDEEKEMMDEREALYHLNAFALKYFKHVLFETDEGKSVGLSYFKERDYTTDTIKKFDLGYSPESWDALTRHCLSEGYKIEYLLRTGLAIDKEGRHYDRFRSRVIFPIHNLSGRVIGFGGRILGREENKPKYVNSPESEIYNKSAALYGLHMAKSEIIRNDKCLLVEGYTDVISMHQAGFENVVASSGTALTADQIRLIRRFTKNITILYDGDEAGIKASFRGIDLILEQGMNVKIILFPEGDDPDSFVRRHRRAEVKDFLAEEKDFIRFKTGLLMGETGGDPVKRAGLIREIVETISLIPDSIYRSVYIKECSSLLETPEQVLVNEMNKIIRARFKKEQARFGDYLPEAEPLKIAETPKIDLSDSEAQEREIVRLLLMYGMENINIENDDERPAEIQVAKYLVESILSDDLRFSKAVYQMIFDKFSEEYKQGSLPAANNFINHEMEQVRSTAADLMSSPYELSRNWGKRRIYVLDENSRLKNLVLNTILSFKIKKLEVQLGELDQRIRDAGGDDISLTLLLHERIELKKISDHFNARLSRIITH